MATSYGPISAATWPFLQHGVQQAKEVYTTQVLCGLKLFSWFGWVDVLTCFDTKQLWCDFKIFSCAGCVSVLKDTWPIRRKWKTSKLFHCILSKKWRPCVFQSILFIYIMYIHFKFANHACPPSDLETNPTIGSWLVWRTFWIRYNCIIAKTKTVNINLSGKQKTKTVFQQLVCPEVGIICSCGYASVQVDGPTPKQAVWE